MYAIHGRMQSEQLLSPLVRSHCVIRTHGEKVILIIRLSQKTCNGHSRVSLNCLIDPRPRAANKVCALLHLQVLTV